MSLKVEINPNVKSDIWVLESQPTFAAYYKKYGEELAERYERGSVIVVPLMPLQCDLPFLQAVTFPAAWKKIGSANKMDRDILVRGPNGVEWNPKHIFCKGGVAPDLNYLYLYDQINVVNRQIRVGLHQMFPRYFGMHEGNLTWRFTPTENEVMHYDGYPTFNEEVSWLRLKFFINMDSMARIWRISHHMSHLLETCFDPRLDQLPDTINAISVLMGTTDILFTEPTHRVEWPALAAVFANGDVIAHEVIFGRRAIGGDFAIPPQQMLHPELHAERQLPSWLANRARNRAPQPAAPSFLNVS